MILVLESWGRVSAGTPVAHTVLWVTEGLLWEDASRGGGRREPYHSGRVGSIVRSSGRYTVLCHDTTDKRRESEIGIKNNS